MAAKPRPKGRKRKQREFIQFDEREDVLASFDLIDLLLPKLKKHPSYWKWVIVAAQNALQGALVCALSGSAGIGAYQKRLQKSWLDWFDKRQGPPPPEKLEDFRMLLKWGCDPKRMSQADSVPLALTTAQMRDLQRLHAYFRNNFSHFTPKGWSIQAAGLPRIVLTAIEAAEYLMLNSERARIHLSGNQLKRIERSATAARVAFG